jgi:hypothetical protein
VFLCQTKTCTVDDARSAMNIGTLQATLHIGGLDQTPSIQRVM